MIADDRKIAARRNPLRVWLRRSEAAFSFHVTVPSGSEASAVLPKKAFDCLFESTVTDLLRASAEIGQSMGTTAQ
ncbi:MAG: hypothetical protein ACJ8FS_08745 [Sphingomicrobium sp.]